jgi:nucleoside-diphosphate-sugar epimerase
MNSIAISEEDVSHFLRHTVEIWDEFKGARIFVTGGTGFVGKWLVESFLAANDSLSLNASLVLLSRNPNGFVHEMPHIAKSRSVSLIQGDVRDFDFPDGDFSHVIHAATDVAAVATPTEIFDVSVLGSRRVLEFCKLQKVRKILFVSSGAIYGRQPSEVDKLAENYIGAPSPTDVGSAYAQGKRAAEWLMCAHAAEFKSEIIIARCFAFVGPHLPLDKQFAIGNFIADILGKKDIHIASDGTALRSYLHAADMVVWLWTILAKGKSGEAYNVGSDEEISILNLARTIAELHGDEICVNVARQAVDGVPPQKYIPNIDKVRNELGLDIWIPLKDGIQRTVKWHQKAKDHQ